MKGLMTLIGTHNLPSRHFKTLDEFLDFPYFDISVRRSFFCGRHVDLNPIYANLSPSLCSTTYLQLATASSWQNARFKMAKA